MTIRRWMRGAATAIAASTLIVATPPTVAHAAGAVAQDGIRCDIDVDKPIFDELDYVVVGEGQVSCNRTVDSITLTLYILRNGAGWAGPGSTDPYQDWRVLEVGLTKYGYYVPGANYATHVEAHVDFPASANQAPLDMSITSESVWF